VANGRLAKYTFIEPRLIFNENDEHPPSFVIGNITLPSNVLDGEKLINKVYNAIRKSSSTTGNNAENTLLIITYDEHGGCYDHVQPPGAVPPYIFQPDTEMGFKFDRLGIRVTTVLVSAYINSGTVINENLTHTSVIKTMSDKWNLGHLTNRDLSSPNISNAFNLSVPRHPDTWPIPIPRQDPIEGDKNYYLNLELTSLQKGIIGLANAIGNNSGKLPEEIKTVRDGLMFLESIKKKLNISFCT
jgi:phospholipase C